MDNGPLDPLYAEVFSVPENGTPDNITQAGCLALARLGREAWSGSRYFCESFFGHPCPTSSKKHTTANACGCPSR
ncbi:MAG: hypothetical protein WC685_08505, partial [Methylobacter sp.]